MHIYSKERKDQISDGVMDLHSTFSWLYALHLILPSLMLCCQNHFVTRLGYMQFN